MKKSLKISKSKIRILLVDDYNLFRAGIRQLLLDEEDMQVIGEAEDTNEAQALIQLHKPDVIVLGIKLSTSNDFGFIRWVRSSMPAVGVLILMDHDGSYAIDVLQHGANGYVFKTAGHEELIQAVRDVNECKPTLASGNYQKTINNIIKQCEKTGSVNPLTGRELDVLRLVSMGYTNNSIGLQLNISDRIVQGYLLHIFNKMQTESRMEAVLRAMSLGWIPYTILSPVKGSGEKIP